MSNLNFNKSRFAWAHLPGLVLAAARGLAPRLRHFGLLGALGALLLLPSGQALGAGRPSVDLSYYDGSLFYMLGAHVIMNPSANQLAQAKEIYVLAYPINPSGSTTLGPLTLPSGYQPTCDPCFTAAIPPQYAYHDHVLTGVPGEGSETAGAFKAPWKIILLMYTPTAANGPDFTPITSADDIDAAEAAGEFLAINPGGDNPYEIETGKILICPIVGRVP